MLGTRGTRERSIPSVSLAPRRPPIATDPSGCRAYLVCRAGFAGRDTPLARPSNGTIPCPVPTRDVSRVGLLGQDVESLALGHGVPRDGEADEDPVGGLTKRAARGVRWLRGNQGNAAIAGLAHCADERDLPEERDAGLGGGACAAAVREDIGAG